MKEKIQDCLKQLIGLPLTRTTRAADMECIKFGTLYEKDNKGVEWQVGEFGLHLQCPWRITKDNVILVGSDDLLEQPNENAGYDENFHWDTKGGNLRDVKLKAFIKTQKHLVLSVVADELGGFELILSNNVKLTAFPALSSKNKYSEYWRLLDNRGDKASNFHFIVTPNGIDLV
ncbi:MAG: hypothetical protein GX905_09970 [Bacteroidales bacterium]|nr:hypothetical protein [Bacteroidales bacterium]